MPTCDTLHLSFLGRSALIVSPDHALLDELAYLCEAFISSSPAPADCERIEITVYKDSPALSAWSVSRLIAFSCSATVLAAKLESYLCRTAIRFSQHLVHIHGAAVGYRGCGVLIPGISGIGKTTLALSLVAHGFTLFSDDITFIDPTSRLFSPFWRRFHLDLRSLHLLAAQGLAVPEWCAEAREGSFPPSAFSLNTPPPPQPLRCVLLVDRTRMPAGAWEQIAQAEAAIALIPHSATFREGNPRALDMLVHLLAPTECFRISTANLQEAAATIHHLVAMLDR